jgi:demethylmenaquinone methyltransferase/2-methoxy-6-polyprenyl-1,4-benzoquinol methylase
MAAQLSEREEQRQKKFDDIWGNELKEVFSDVAEEYESANAFITFGLWGRMRRKFIKQMDLFDGAQVLDVCAGTNAVGIDMLRAHPKINVTAVDRSEEMQAAGGRLAKKLGLSIKSVIHDVHQLPFPDNSFDICTLEAATRHLVPTKVFAEIFRVLKPGGYFHHNDLCKPKNRLMAVGYMTYLKVMLPITSFLFFRGKSFLGEKEKTLKVSQYFLDAIDNFYTTDELSRIMEEAGFQDIEVKYLLAGTSAAHKARKPL